MANLEKGYDFMKQAEIEESTGNYGEATTLYTDAVQFLLKGLKQAENERLTPFQRKKLGSEFLTRNSLQHLIHTTLSKAERLKQTAPSAPKASSAPHTSFQSDSKHYTTRIPSGNDPYHNYQSSTGVPQQQQSASAPNFSMMSSGYSSGRSSPSSTHSNTFPSQLPTTPSSERDQSTQNLSDDLSALNFSVPRENLLAEQNPSEVMNKAFQSFNDIMNKKNQMSDSDSLTKFIETISILLDSFEVQDDEILKQQHTDHILTCVQNIDNLSKKVSNVFAGLSSRRIEQLYDIVEYLQSEALDSQYSKNFPAAYSSYLKAAECCMLCLKYGNISQENKFKTVVLTLMNEAEDINVLFKEQKKLEKSRISGDHSDRFTNTMRTYCDFVTPAVEAEKQADLYLSKDRLDRALNMFEQAIQHFEASLKYEQNLETRTHLLEKKLYLKAKMKTLEKRK